MKMGKSDRCCFDLEVFLGQYETYSRRLNLSPTSSASGLAAPRNEPV
ncbi:MAG: hypothetical protein QE493_03560 [Verrucomicrobiae bacterium]|nr:hypothetical protein [Verrucomicrobiae bacterium]